MKRKLLYLSDYIPYNPLSGTELVHVAFAKYFSEYFDIDYVGFNNNNKIVEKSPIESYVQQIYSISHSTKTGKIDRLFRKVDTLINKKPIFWKIFNSPDYNKTVKLICKKNKYDVAIIDAPYLCGGNWRKYIGRIPTLHVVHDVLENLFTRENSAGIKSISLNDIKLVAEFERKSWASSDLCWTFINENSKIVSNYSRVVNSPLGYEYNTNNNSLSTIRNNRNILFVGSLQYGPNYYGIKWFIETILPKLVVKYPDISLTIVGKGQNLNFTDLPIQNIQIHCNVPSVYEYYDKCNIAVIPLLYGSGFRVKVIEGMFMHRPLVSTSVGCEGIGLENGKNILIADNAGDFTDCIIRLLDNPNLSKTIADNALTFAKENFIWEKTLEPIKNAIFSLINTEI